MRTKELLEKQLRNLLALYKGKNQELRLRDSKEERIRLGKEVVVRKFQKVIREALPLLESEGKVEKAEALKALRSLI